MTWKMFLLCTSRLESKADEHVCSCNHRNYKNSPCCSTSVQLERIHHESDDCAYACVCVYQWDPMSVIA